MINNDLDKRFNYIYSFIVLVCLILVARILYLGVIEGSSYKVIAENSIYKDITNPSPRGEIRDKNGVLLAGNKPIFTVKIAKNEIENLEKTTKKKKEKINEIAKRLSDILIKNNESIEDSFPIIINGSKYSFTFDDDIKKWQTENGIDSKMNAKEAFYQIAKNFSDNSNTKIDISTMSVYEIQKILNDNGIYPPISVTGDMEYTKNLDKIQWLGDYNIKEKDISAKDAFNRIRENRLIDPKLSEKDARNILVIIDSMLAKKYLQYEPALIAKDISQKTVALINENIISLSGVSVQVEPLRYYPQGNLASHILGQIGKISASDESYLQDSRYSKSDYVGKSGIEYIYEKELKGTNGYERVLVDSAGKKIKDIESKTGTSGNTVYLSIDAKLQKVAEEALEKTLKSLQVGGTYKSKWGNMHMAGATKIYKNANAGAIVAIDVQTGKVLALASYPSYDPNIFTSGLTMEQLKSLEPENPNDPLSPKPMFNAATMTAVQPGSTFKMIIALAGLENGLNPYYSIEDKGYIDLGGVRFGNWLWNQSRQTQGFENVITALKDSNNYYFYCISVGYNFATKQKIPMQDMDNGNDILEMAKRFDLDKKSGIEIYEVTGKIPDPQVKYNQQRESLKNDITRQMKSRFKDITPENTDEYNKRISNMISWIDENPSRGEIIKRLSNLKVKDDSLEYIADLLKYTYFMHAHWSMGDIFNMSIGQGEHQYTPVQMVKYVAAIANGGYLHRVSLVDKLVNKSTGVETKIEKETKKIDIKDTSYYDFIRKGMEDVSDEGTAKSIFNNFPVKVAAKTGTAETQGKIPTKDEVYYYLSHLDNYYVDKYQVLELAKKLKKESTVDYKEEYYIKSAILKLNPKLKLDDLDRFKETYADYSWFVAYAPYDKPKIAVVTLLFQGGSGGHAGPASRDVIAQYMGLNKEEVKLNDEKDDLKINVEQDKSNTEKKNYTYNQNIQQTNNQSYNNRIYYYPNQNTTTATTEKRKTDEQKKAPTTNNNVNENIVSNNTNNTINDNSDNTQDTKIETQEQNNTPEIKDNKENSDEKQDSSEIF